jgi:hypothetical protein
MIIRFFDDSKNLIIKKSNNQEIEQSRNRTIEIK